MWPGDLASGPAGSSRGPRVLTCRVGASRELAAGHVPSSVRGCLSSLICSADTYYLSAVINHRTQVPGNAQSVPSALTGRACAPGQSRLEVPVVTEGC